MRQRIFGFGRTGFSTDAIPHQRLVRFRFGQQTVFQDQAQIIRSLRNTQQRGGFKESGGQLRVVFRADAFDIGDAEVVLCLRMTFQRGDAIPVERAVDVFWRAQTLMVLDTQIIGGIADPGVRGLREPVGRTFVILLHA